MKKILIVCVISALLSGCSNSPVKVSKAEYVKEDKQYSFKTPMRNGAPVTFIRDSGMMGAGCDYFIYVNSIKGASIGSGEKVTLQLPQGNANITGTFECPLGASMNSTMILPVLSGVESFVRINTSSPKGVVTLEETTSGNPLFTCPLPSKKYSTQTAWSKNDMVVFMRQTAELTTILRNKARELSVKYRDETLNNCLYDSSNDLKKSSADMFSQLKEKTTAIDEKSALIDAYSKYLSVIDPAMSINQIDMIQASFNAAVNKYELY